MRNTLTQYRVFVAVTVSDLVLKLNFAPYVLLLDLFDHVDHNNVEAKRLGADDTLRVVLKKVGATLLRCNSGCMHDQEYCSDVNCRKSRGNGDAFSSKQTRKR